MSGGNFKRFTVSIAAILIGFLLVDAASAQSSSEESSSEKKFDRWRVGMNTGFATSPNAGFFDLGWDGAFYINENLSIGPWIELGMAEDSVLLLFSANTRYEFEPFSGKLKDTRAFGQAGLGLAHGKNGGNKENDFLINFGMGIDHPINDWLWLGTNLMFNTIPTAPPGGAFVFTWQFVQVSARF
jgi:hypothetical protein